MVLRSLARKLRSFRRPPERDLASVPAVGDEAPDRPRLAPGRPRVVVFLRHVGCAFGEATLDRLASTAREHPDVEFIAITHGDPEIATDWCEQIGLGTVTLAGADASLSMCHDVTDTGIRVLVDRDRSLYAEWGLGRAGWRHLLHPRVTVGSIRAMLAGYRDRTTSGNRWQQSGLFAVDADDVVRSVHVAETADDLPNVDVAVSFLTAEHDEPVDAPEYRAEKLVATVPDELEPAVRPVAADPASTDAEPQAVLTDGEGQRDASDEPKD